MCRIEVGREEGLWLVTVHSDLDGTKQFRGRNLDNVLRDLSADLQLSFGELEDGKVRELEQPEEEFGGGEMDYL